MNRVALLGSTGSIGTQTLSVARALRGHVEVVALAGGRNARTLSSQLSEFRPRLYHSLEPDAVDSCGATMATLEEIASDDGVDTALLLRDRIVITHEVRQVAELWQGRGALLFGLSDKPDEAALPTPDLAARGYQPLHHVEAHMVGLTP